MTDAVWPGSIPPETSFTTPPAGPGFEGTKDAVPVHTGLVVATIVLARIKARSADPSAASLADDAARQAAALPPRQGNRWGEASVLADLGRLFLQLHMREKASYWLERSAEVWRQIQTPAVLESQRAGQLAAIAADLGKH